ncbi:sensor histidine kinase [Marimonas sp. MJW-29]|uniref:histidine kinase n=1 Tax=Sulfitobacter sediminis TaxID=3234186 RepID=A0ABV3RPL5_9RHOB
MTELTGPRLPDTLEGHIAYLLDPTRALGIDEVADLPREDFRPVETTFPDFGYVDENIWLRLEIFNATDDIHSWRIHFRENFKQFLAVHIVRSDGSIDTTYDVGLTDGFDKRPIPYPEMVAPMELAPGETATLYITYWSEGSSHLAFAFETAASFAATAATRTAKNFLYYGMMILPVLLALLGFAVYRHAVFPAYICNWMAALLYVMHSDGVTFQYLWPESPAWNSFASIPLGAAIIIFAPNFARVFLNTRVNNPVIDKLLWAVIIVATALVISSLFLDRQMLKKVLVLLSLISVSMCAFSGFVAALTRFKEVRFFVLAWIGFLCAAAIMSMRHWLGIEISQDFQNDAIRSVMVIDATLMGLSIADRYNQLRQSRQKAIAERYEEENRNLKLLARLADLEKRYAQETEKLRDRDIASADTLHDLQQPLAVLRLNIRAMLDKKRDTPAAVEEMESSFAYIEDLMAAATQQRENEVTAETLATHRPADDANAFGLRKVTDSVMQMFLPDATAKGLDLRYYPSSNDIGVEPLAAMRVISNLLSNAIKYTDSGKILFCVRRRGDDLRVEIHDTGPGLSSAEFERAKGRSTRIFETAEGKEGKGLGLSIVNEIAEKHGYHVASLCDRAGGLSVGVTFPARQVPQ